MRPFKVGDKVKVTTARQHSPGAWPPGVVVKLCLSPSGIKMIKVRHQNSEHLEGWYPESLEFDNNHRQPCACYECEK